MAKRVKKAKRLAVITAGCLLVMAACYTVFIAPLLEKDKWVYKEETVERGTLKVGVTESSSLKYGISSVRYELDLDIGDDEGSGDSSEENALQKFLVIEEICVAAGQRIEEGEVLIKFTEDSVSDVRKLLESAVIYARSEYVEAQSEYDLSVLKVQAGYDSQMIEARYADSIYQDANTSVDNDISALQVEIAQKTAKITVLQENIETASETYQEALKTYEEASAAMSAAGVDNTVNYMTVQSGYLSALKRYENAKDALTNAQRNLEDTNREIESLQRELVTAQASKDIEKLGLEQNYQESKISSANAEINYDTQFGRLKETLQKAEDDKNKAQEQLEAFEAFVGEDGCLYAEGSGIVTEVTCSAGDRLKNTGILISYAMPDGMTLSVDVAQEDVVDLKVGDKVDITFSAYKDASYRGSIQSINTTAISTNSNTVSYTVIVSVEGDTTLLYGGMTADIIFVKEQKEDVLYVSRNAIIEKGGKTYVYYHNAMGNRELKEVETGISNGVIIEIVSGLEEGDTIYLASRVSSAENVVGIGGDTRQPDIGEGEFSLPKGMEQPGSFEQPEGFGWPGGGMPSGGGMPGRGGKPGGGGNFGGNGER